VIEAAMSKLDCMITVKGTGTTAKYGKPAKDTIKSVREFLIDNDVYYRAVLKHLRECPLCDPLDCLQIYLERRRGEKFGGQTSIGLVKLVFAYDNLLQSRGSQVPPEMLAEFIWRSGNVSTLVVYRDRLSLTQRFQAAQLIFKMSEAEDRHKNHWPSNYRIDYTITEFKKRSLDYAFLLEIAKARANPQTEAEIEELIAVAEVHSS
jgi:hypothetical protein